jgi:hypothetical protein
MEYSGDRAIAMSAIDMAVIARGALAMVAGYIVDIWPDPDGETDEEEEPIVTYCAKTWAVGAMAAECNSHAMKDHNFCELHKCTVLKCPRSSVDGDDLCSVHLEPPFLPG